jgi:hypothetical protein
LRAVRPPRRRVIAVFIPIVAAGPAVAPRFVAARVTRTIAPYVTIAIAIPVAASGAIAVRTGVAICRTVAAHFGGRRLCRH